MLYWHTVGVGRWDMRVQEDHNNNLDSFLNISISHYEIVLAIRPEAMLCSLHHDY